MIANYYTLRLIASDLHHVLEGSRLSHAFSQNKGELVLGFRDAPERGERDHAVVIGCDPSSNFIVLRDSLSRARRNVIDLFGPVTGERVDGIQISSSDREIQIRLSSGRMLLAQMFGSRANVLMCDSQRVILDAFLRNVTPGSPALQASAKPEPDSLPAFRAAVMSPGEGREESIRSALKRLFPRYGNILVRELLHRASISADAASTELSSNDIERAWNMHGQLLGELRGEAAPVLYFEGLTPVEFAPIPLRHLDHLRAERFPDLHAAVRTFLGSVRSRDAFLANRESLITRIRHELEHAEQTLGKLSQETVSVLDADELERTGKLLTAHLHELAKGMSEAIMEDPSRGPGELTRIALDPHLTPAKNAERLFERAKRMRRTVDEQSKRREILEKHCRSLRPVLRDAEEVDTPEDLRQFVNDHRTELEGRGIRITSPDRPAPRPVLPFRVFVVSGGFQVWAGKSGENNDLLTTRHTAKNDLWFHARGVGGSHVVLKVGTGKGEVSALAVQQAAGIAAYYSKMKKASLVPVTMCEGKYVRKPKGAPAGTVTVEREQTIFAEPGLPEGAQG